MNRVFYCMAVWGRRTSFLRACEREQMENIPGSMIACNTRGSSIREDTGGTVVGASVKQDLKVNYKVMQVLCETTDIKILETIRVSFLRLLLLTYYLHCILTSYQYNGRATNHQDRFPHIRATNRTVCINENVMFTSRSSLLLSSKQVHQQ